MSQTCELVSNRSKRELLGRYEECVMLAALACGENATAEDIRRSIEAQMGVVQKFTTVYTTLDRLTCKGLLACDKEDEPSKRKGGKKRTIYSATVKGRSYVLRSLSMMTDMARNAGLVAA